MSAATNLKPGYWDRDEWDNSVLRDAEGNKVGHPQFAVEPEVTFPGRVTAFWWGHVTTAEGSNSRSFGQEDDAKAWVLEHYGFYIDESLPTGE